MYVRVERVPSNPVDSNAILVLTRTGNILERKAVAVLAPIANGGLPQLKFKSHQ